MCVSCNLARSGVLFSLFRVLDDIIYVFCVCFHAVWYICLATTRAKLMATLLGPTLSCHRRCYLRRSSSSVVVVVVVAVIFTLLLCQYTNNSHIIVHALCYIMLCYIILLLLYGRIPNTMMDCVDIEAMGLQMGEHWRNVTNVLGNASNAANIAGHAHTLENYCKVGSLSVLSFGSTSLMT